MRDKAVLWLVIILSIATFLRVYHIKSTPPGLYADEAIDGNDAIQAAQTHNFKVFYTEDNGREGLYVNIAAFFIARLGNTPWALRLPAVIFGILTVLGLYFLGKELYSKNIGLLAAFFLAVNFWHINFSRIAFRAIMAPCFAVWAFYFFLVALRHAYERPKSWSSGAYSALAGILFGLGAYTYIAYRVLPLLAILAFILVWRKYGGRINWRAWHAGLHLIMWSLIIFLPLGLYFARHPADFTGRTSEISVFSEGNPLKIVFLNTLKTLGMFFFTGDGNWRHNYSGAPELFWPVAIFFLAGAVLALKRFRREKLQSGFLFSWFLLALAPVVFSSEGIPHALRSILLVPPVFILAALGAQATYRLLRYRLNKNVLNVGAALLFLLIALHGYKEYFIDWANNSDVAGAFNSDYVNIGEALNALPAKTPKYVIVQAGGVPVDGIPMPAQTVMYITDTFTPDKQAAKNIHYVLPGQENKIPPGAYTAVIN